MSAAGSAVVQADVAEVLIDAAANRVGITGVTGTFGEFAPAEGYEIQDAVVAARVAEGHEIIGAKLGLTSVAKQRQMNVSDPLYGWLTADMTIGAGEPLVTGRFIQPRCEPEVAFVMGQDLAGPDVTAEQVLAATASVHVAVDVLDSRYSGYTFTLPDVIADNCSAAAYTLGEAIDPRSAADLDLRLVGAVMLVNGELAATAAGAAVMGNPAEAVAWLVRALAARGEGLRAGQVVLSGALTEAVAVSPGDEVTVRIDRLGELVLRCE